MKKRKWKFRIAGGAVTLLGIYLMAVGYGETIILTIATVVLIFGIAIWSMATPESYNSMTDMIAMISMEKPLKTFYIYDAMHTEIFRMTKELLHALPTYRFYRYGEPYGVLKKQFALVRDQFSMELPEGKLELREYAGSIGHNYSVKLNGTMIGAIVDNMDLTVGNIMFDNAFLIVYDAKYLPQLTALAVMSVRELARDKDGGLSNRS